jgi:hypothetical protein
MKSQLNMIKCCRDHILKLKDRFNSQIHEKRFFSKAAFWVAIFIITFALGTQLPEGFDWVHYYKPGILHPLWTPWSKAIVNALSPFSYGFVFALSVIGIAARTIKCNKSPLPLILVFLSLPTLWVFYMGNLDGLILFGMLIMPVGIPLVLMKPQLAAFSLLASRKWFIAGIIWFALSLVIWGFWLDRFFIVTSSSWKSEWIQDITLFPWGILLGLPLLYFSRGDQDLLMSAGSFLTPHLFPYHFIILMPSIARMKPIWMIITFVISWTPLLANWLGPEAWHFGNLIGLSCWFGVFLNKKNRIPKPIHHISDLFNEGQDVH